MTGVSPGARAFPEPAAGPSGTGPSEEGPHTVTPQAARRRRVPRTRLLYWAIVALLVAGGLAFVMKGANEPPDPFFRNSGRQPVPDFGEVAYRIDKTRQQTRCALLAESASQRAQGLMHRTDLAGYDGMLFVFPDDTTTSFYMKDTPLPLSIAWFDSSGRFVSSADMEPCLDRPTCPLYSAAGPYLYALEVERGGLAALGIGPGSQISVGGPCP